jgi:excisionase family DNA binding protein
MDQPNRLLTAEEAAQYLGLHPETVRKMAREQRIPRVKVGRFWRFRPLDLDDWAARGGTLLEDRQTTLGV